MNTTSGRPSKLPIVRITPRRLHTASKHHAGLIRPRQSRAIRQLHHSHRRHLSAKYQPLQYIRRKISQPQLPADMTLCEAHSDRQIPDRAELADLHAPPPSPCPADGNTVRSIFERMRASTDRISISLLNPASQNSG
ncbi:MAG: hypothetical protein O3C59_03620, partial [Proteobacteria bacterium]|nr:hypothetical protein [Pseudomonadota bacterium]